MRANVCALPKKRREISIIHCQCSRTCVRTPAPMAIPSHSWTGRPLNRGASTTRKMRKMTMSTTRLVMFQFICLRSACIGPPRATDGPGVPWHAGAPLAVMAGGVEQLVYQVRRVASPGGVISAVQHEQLGAPLREAPSRYVAPRGRMLPVRSSSLMLLTHDPDQDAVRAVAHRQDQRLEARIARGGAIHRVDSSSSA